ncbi:MAG TPA: hypothetical protein VHE30_16290 [Polyangiaceae bacterium]|nr:hypothetical protein [Polyangiaceae bacterium]
MTARARLFGAAVSLAAIAVPRVLAAAEEPARWDPGRETTSRLPGEVKGDDVTDDGVYGRFDGLFDLGVDAGAEIADGGPSGALRASLHYAFMAGVYAGYTDSFGGSSKSERALALGVDLRPAFIPRWSKGWENGPSVLDLAVDSISLGVGAYFREPRGQSFGDRRGCELSLGFGVPLTGRATSFWLGARGFLRWDDPGTNTASTAMPAALFTLAYHAAL